MNDRQVKVIEFLSRYRCATFEQLAFFTGCTKQDICGLLNLNHIVKDEKTNLFRHKLKNIDTRMGVALDVLMIVYKNNVKYYEPSTKYPVILTITTKQNVTCDIVVLREIEYDAFYEKVDRYSKADKIILVLQGDGEDFNKYKLKTKKEVLICKYPIEIFDKFN